MQGQEGQEAKTTFSAALGRLNVAGSTGVVIEKVNQEGTVGLKPYYGVPFMLLPRMIWADKPMYGSIDGTPYGLLRFKAMYWMTGKYGASSWMGASAQPYWIGGIMGVIVIGFVGGVFISLIWHYWLAHRPLGLVVMLPLMALGLDLYRDFTWPLQTIVQRGVMLLILFALTKPLAMRSRHTDLDYEDEPAYEAEYGYEHSA